MENCPHLPSDFVLNNIVKKTWVCKSITSMLKANIELNYETIMNHIEIISLLSIN